MHDLDLPPFEPAVDPRQRRVDFSTRI